MIDMFSSLKGAEQLKRKNATLGEKDTSQDKGMAFHASFLRLSPSLFLVYRIGLVGHFHLLIKEGFILRSSHDATFMKYAHIDRLRHVIDVGSLHNVAQPGYCSINPATSRHVCLSVFLSVRAKLIA